MKKIADLTKKDTVIVKGFTGIKLGVFTVEAVSEKSITVLKRNGEKMIFSKKTGKQTNVEEGKEKYANSIVPDDGSYVAPERKKNKKETEKKKSSKKSKDEDEDEEEDDEDEEEEDEDEEEEAAQAKKTKKKTESKSSKSKKKSSKKSKDEDEDDEGDYEEV